MTKRPGSCTTKENFRVVSGAKYLENFRPLFVQNCSITVVIENIFQCLRGIRVQSGLFHFKL